MVMWYWQKYYAILTPNHTFLVCFGNISGEFSWAGFCILGTASYQNTHSRTKWAWSAAKRYQKGSTMYLLYPNSSTNVAILGQWLDMPRYQDIRTAETASDWPMVNLVMISIHKIIRKMAKQISGVIADPCVFCLQMWIPFSGRECRQA